MLDLLGLALVLLVAVYLVAPAWLLELEFERQARFANLRTRQVDAAGHTWKFYDGGRGAPVVLVHGFSGSKENWLPTARVLTDARRVVIPDLAGWNESSRLADADYAIIPQVERLASFLDELGLRRVHLVGHSMGGHIAGVFAARYPARVESLVLVSAAGVHFKENDFARAVIGGATPFNFDDRKSFDAFMQELFVDPQWLPGRFKDVLVNRNKANHAFHEALLRPMSTDAGAFLLERQLERVVSPTTVIWCRDDRILDVSSTETFQAKLPEARIVVLDGCGHMPMMEVPDVLGAAILDATSRASP